MPKTQFAAKVVHHKTCEYEEVDATGAYIATPSIPEFSLQPDHPKSNLIACMMVAQTAT